MAAGRRSGEPYGRRWLSGQRPRPVGSLAGVVHVLMLQPSEIDQPQRLGDWLRDAGAELQVVRPGVDGVPDDLAGVDAVVCLGGEMNALDDGECPWLADLRTLLSGAVAKGMPVLGVCLGGQLLAAATGGGVRVGEHGPEAGTLLVAKRDAAAGDPLFDELPMTPLVIQFHNDEVHRLPPGATLLASSLRYPHQAFRVGRSGYGVQFHIETTPQTVLSWADRDPAAAAAVPPGQLDGDRLAAAHAEIAEVWAPFAARFVALAAGERAPADGTRRSLPLLGG